MSVSSTLYIVLFKTSVSSLIFCLVVLFIIESRLWKSSTIVADLPISPLNSVYFCFIDFRALLPGVYMFIIVLSA